MKDRLQKLNKGSLTDLMGTALCLLTILIIMITSIHYMKIMECKKVVDSYARDYLLILETRGELNSKQMLALKESINDMGFSDVSITFNKDNRKADYGKDVSLKIVINASWQELGISKVFNYISDNYVISSYVCSTSKA